MARYTYILGNATNNPAESVDASGDTGDPFVWQLQNAAGAVLAGLSPAGLLSGTLAGSFAAPFTASVAALAAPTNGSTITPTALVNTVGPGSNVTGCKLATPTAAGFAAGAIFALVNISNVGFSVTFASNPATAAIGDSSHRTFVLESQSVAWFVAKDANVWYVMQPQAQADPAVNAGGVITGGTLTPNNAMYTLIRCLPAGAITGVIVAPGVYNGQVIDVMNEAAAANTITFAAVGTSNVADGATTAIAGVTGRRLVWNSQAAVPAWYRAF